MTDQFSKLPPHSIDAEMCLLASMMLDKDIIGTAVQIVTRDAFYQPDHQILFDVLLKLYEINRPIDAVIVREELIKRGQLEEIGGTAYLGQSSPPSPQPPTASTTPTSSAKNPSSVSSSQPPTKTSAKPTHPTNPPNSSSTKPKNESSKSPRKKSPEHPHPSAKSQPKSTKCSKTKAPPES